MKLRRVIIKNFRCLVDIEVPLDDNTVLVGENNSGKTSFLDALNIVLSGGFSGRNNPFDEYDYHLAESADSPYTSSGITLELWFQEDEPDQWPDTLIQALHEIVQIDPVKDIDSIGLRLRSQYDNTQKDFKFEFEFLTLDGQAIGKRQNPRRFLSYIRLFYLSALRDADQVFSSRSQLWGRILRTLEMDQAQKEELLQQLSEINDSILKADSRLEKVQKALATAPGTLAMEDDQSVSIRPLPLQIWDLMARAEVAIQSYGTKLKFPLARHGQGIQSLSVIYLFQAYIDVFLKPSFEPETEAILAIEEPEAHLHPQATRALASRLNQINAQKIISSHSPDFIQEISLKNIRMFRRQGPASKILYVRQTFAAQVPKTDDLSKFLRKHSSKYVYDDSAASLLVIGKVEAAEYRELLMCYTNQRECHDTLQRLCEESQLFLSDDELAMLETQAKRIRGDILFARAWLLCEGPSDYQIIHYFAELMCISFDQLGIALIDAQNNGSPGIFVGLARVFEIPWMLICDNDQAGKDFAEQIRKRNVSEEEIKVRVRLLPEGDMETFLIQNGFFEVCRTILTDMARELCPNPSAKEWYIAKYKHDEIVYQISGTYLIRLSTSQPTNMKVVSEGETVNIQNLLDKSSPQLRETIFMN